MSDRLDDLPEDHASTDSAGKGPLPAAADPTSPTRTPPAPPGSVVEQFADFTLPPSGFPLCSAVSGLIAAAIGGLLLFLGWHTGIYLDLLYDFLLGAVIGLAISWGLPRTHRVAQPVAVVLVILCVILAYAFYNVAYFLQMHSVDKTAGLTLESVWETLRGAPERRALFQIEELTLGSAGSLLLWFLEFLLAVYVAATGVVVTLRLREVLAAPPVVLQRLFTLDQEGYKDHHFREELQTRGVSDPAKVEFLLRALLSLKLLGSQGKQLLEQTEPQATSEPSTRPMDS